METVAGPRGQGQVTTLWWLIVKTLHLEQLVEALKHAEGYLSLLVRHDLFEPMYQAQLKAVIRGVVELQTACADLDLPMTAIAIRRGLEELKCLMALSQNGRHHPMSRLLNENAATQEVNTIIDTLRDETSLRLYFYLPDGSRDLLESPKPFGDGVWHTFPEAITDAEEAAKCLALLRPTACVFHCMRVNERGFRKLIVESLGITDFLSGENATWGWAVSRIRKEANKPDARLPAAWRGRQARLMQLALHIESIGNAFRHPTMHCEMNYTVDQARDVFHATGVFMRRLCDDLRTDSIMPRGHDGQDTENAEGDRDSDPVARGGAALEQQAAEPEVARILRARYGKA